MFYFNLQRNAGARKSDKKKSKNGQAAIEYILVVVVTAAIFGTLFYAIRQNLFELWVCYIGPKVQSPSGCNSIDDCWDALGPEVQAQRSICNK